MDVVVLGGGVDALAAAVRLGQRGQEVLLLHPQAEPGGLARQEPLGEGYGSSGLWTDTSRLSEAALTQLGLKKHGLRRRARRASLALADDGPGLLLDGSMEQDCAELEDKLPEAVQGYRALWAEVEPLRRLVNRLLDTAPPDPRGGSLWSTARTAVGIRRLGARRLQQLLRTGPRAVVDWLRDYVQHPLLLAHLCAPALRLGRMGPRSPQGAAHFLLEEAARGSAEVVGGGAALVQSMLAAADAALVQRHPSCRVEQLRVERGALVGLRLSDGQELSCRWLISALSPRQTLLELLPPLTLTSRQERAVARIRSRGQVAMLRLGLDALPHARGRPERPLFRARLAGHPDDLERAWDAVKHRRLPAAPPLEIHCSQGAEVAPEGHCALIATTHFAASDLRGGWTRESREVLAERMLAALEGACPGLRDSIRAQELLVPPDLEARYGLEGGHPAQAERALDQLWLMRPTPDLSRYRSPVRGLYLSGPGCHPGGVLRLSAGLAAADALIADR